MLIVMCRLYGHVAVNPTDASDYLYLSECSLLNQSVAKKDFQQKDGWGISSLNEKSFKLFKSAGHVFKEKRLLEKQARLNVSKITIAHLRAASNPLKLPMKDLIAREHSQPFNSGSCAFAHNGSLNIAAASRERLLGKFRSRLEGNNDSEIYFWLVMKWVEACKGDIEKAFAKSVHDIWDLWRKLSKKERDGHEKPYTGFNVLFSEGKKLYALCHSINPVQRLSLCLKDQPYNRLAYRMNPLKDRLVIGSEKMSRESDWKVVPMHTLLVAEEKNGTIAYRIKKFPWKT